MKKLLHLSLVALVILSLSSCVKTVDAPPRQVVVDPLVGSWYLYDATEQISNSWIHFDAGVNGTLSFYQNGSAAYDDGNIYMQGSWYTNDVSTGYYDEYGNYYTNLHQSFQTALSGNGNGSLSLYFDDLSLSGSNQFTGTYYNGKSIERYVFRRE